MRLKYLFFPVILIIAVAVFFGYINPLIDTFKSANNDYNASQQQLLVIQTKKNALESLGSTIADGKGDSALVYEYLPKDKVEEKIIGEVNYAAANSDVFLNNIGIVDAPVVATVGLDQTPKAKPVEVIRNIQATIMVEGDYDKLKTFINGIQHIQLYNSIKSLNIATIEKATNNTDPSVVAVSSATTIAVKLIVDFGYLKQNKIDDKKLTSFKPDIDNQTIQNLKAYIQGSVPKINTAGLNIGSNNPFLP